MLKQGVSCEMVFIVVECGPWAGGAVVLFSCMKYYYAWVSLANGQIFRELINTQRQPTTYIVLNNAHLKHHIHLITLLGIPTSHTDLIETYCYSQCLMLN